MEGFRLGVCVERKDMGESWCLNCGHKQETDHLGSENCVKCNKRDWLDIYSWQKCQDAWQEERKIIGQR